MVRRLLSVRNALFALIVTFTSVAFAADPAEFVVGGFTFQRPENWQWIKPSSAMRKAELQPPAAKDAKAPEVTFFHFGPGQGGGTQANIDRWLSQFGGKAASNPKIEEGQLKSTRITMVWARGTFQSGMPGGPTTPMDNYALVGAILEDPKEGDVFVKMTGPAASVDAAAPQFETMVFAAAK